MKRIFTIGYEGATVPEFLAALTQAGVEQVIDVRQLPLSRRPGFSKKPLAAELAEAGIGYVHLKALGTPKPGRDAAKKGDRATLEKVYAGQLELPEAQAEGAMMLSLAKEKPSRVAVFRARPGDVPSHLADGCGGRGVGRGRPVRLNPGLKEGLMTEYSPPPARSRRRRVGGAAECDVRRGVR